MSSHAFALFRTRALTDTDPAIFRARSMLAAVDEVVGDLDQNKNSSTTHLAFEHTNRCES